jgi:hypothetical protein
MPLNASGKISLLRVHDRGTAYGPPTDRIDVEVVMQFVGRPADEGSSFATIQTDPRGKACSTSCAMPSTTGGSHISTSTSPRGSTTARSSAPAASTLSPRTCARAASTSSRGKTGRVEW